MQIRYSDIEAYAEQHGITTYSVHCMVVAEGFLRRAAQVEAPFVLKGSYVTRQYLKEGWRRIPADLDWIGLGKVDAAVLNRWAIAVTTCNVDDGIQFRDFSENAFWRQIDYAMDEDFPTVNTDIDARIDDKTCELYGLDVSYNVKLIKEPSAIDYVPLFGEPFTLPLCCGIDQQIAWKLHQCLVRPRFKDLFDLTLLLREIQVDAAAVMKALADECTANGTLLIGKFNVLHDGTLDRHEHWQPNRYRKATPNELFSSWRHDDVIKSDMGSIEETMRQIYIGTPDIANALPEFLQEFAHLLRSAGLAPAADIELPSDIIRQSGKANMPPAHGPIEEKSPAAQAPRRGWFSKFLGRK